MESMRAMCSLSNQASTASLPRTGDSFTTTPAPTSRHTFLTLTARVSPGHVENVDNSLATYPLCLGKCSAGTEEKAPKGRSGGLYGE